MDSSLRSFIEERSQKLARLEALKNAAFFDASVTGEEEHFKRFEALELEYSALLSDKPSFEYLAQAEKENAIEDPLLSRQAHLLYLMHLSHQLPPELQQQILSLEISIEKKFTLFRARARNQQLTDNQVEHILETSSDNAYVKQVWEASKDIGTQVAPEVLKLVKLRNQAAQLLGFDNYHQMSLILDEQDPDALTTLFDELDELTRDAFLEEKKDIDAFLAAKFELQPQDLRPWHYQDRFFQEAPAIHHVALDHHFEGKNLEDLTQQYFSSIGIDISPILNRSDLYEKPGKNQHAYCINIDRREDIRVLCNLRPNHKWMNTMLHEFGHAAYERYYREDLPYLLREPAHTFTTEAVAMFFGRLAGNPTWLQAMNLISPQQASELSVALNKKQRTAQLVFSRWVQVMFRFEQSLYDNPDQDLNALWWKLASRYQGLTPPEELKAAYWASKIHVATAPCYYHNYLLGELLASQFHHTLLQSDPKEAAQPSFPSFHDNAAVGTFFRKKVFAPGASLPWHLMIQQATGEPLDPSYYAKQFVSPEKP